uniref:BCNT-C domain-containing protein n=1 Tax=Chromera velia CCMP2878 TaxID=1169474 RepID=A0A0G4I6D6_9ALVE|mmetsp:Transcript_39063/g.76850  ORF Transcript_39063/g.76850 Transcript_39063/m.76850 type:complete len:442 (-) Transcript_39063:61-1386(-)|eukprot:Cvel_11302.t1-p1 / transcript=Cvel_11302.t1 / gene=Cvel_11302 / organism=Chromera_velia_CCMP2878 / gene_product=hypothetical protein / transcript_product=hypothetical protein / location=Cvel_scaffold706:54582-55904(-) / protein_length=441 / sequence_SO=supercontig / SO=protein_coding / is_pseudo=false
MAASAQNIMDMQLNSEDESEDEDYEQSSLDSEDEDEERERRRGQTTKKKKKVSRRVKEYAALKGISEEEAEKQINKQEEAADREERERKRRAEVEAEFDEMCEEERKTYGAPPPSSLSLPINVPKSAQLEPAFLSRLDPSDRHQLSESSELMASLLNRPPDLPKIFPPLEPADLKKRKFDSDSAEPLPENSNSRSAFSYHFRLKPPEGEQESRKRRRKEQKEQMDQFTANHFGLEEMDQFIASHSGLVRESESSAPPAAAAAAAAAAASASPLSFETLRARAKKESRGPDNPEITAEFVSKAVYKVKHADYIEIEETVQFGTQQVQQKRVIKKGTEEHAKWLRQQQHKESRTVGMQGLDELQQKISGPQKVSAVTKTQHMWKEKVRDEKLEDELRGGKGAGIQETEAFLTATDWKMHERERGMRAQVRKEQQGPSEKGGGR